MTGFFIGMSLLLFLIALFAGAAGRIMQGAANVGNGVAQGVGSAMDGVGNMLRAIANWNWSILVSWITGERVVFCIRLVVWLAFMGVIMVLLGMVYWTLSAEGLRRAFADLGMKLYHIPFLSSLASFRETKVLDLAHIVSLMIMLCSLYILHEVAKMQLGVQTALYCMCSKFANYERMVQTLAVAMLGIDLFLFYLSVTASSWSSASFDFKAFFVSVGYVCVLVVITLGSILLEPFSKRRIDEVQLFNEGTAGEDSQGGSDDRDDDGFDRVYAGA